MLELIKKAAERTYHPNEFDEEEDLQALLFLHLGSAQVVDVAYCIFRTPAASTIWRCSIIPQRIASPSFPTSHKVESNITASFKAIQDILRASTQKVFHAVLMFDKISVERRPHWDDKTNKILGVCHKHGQGTSLEFTSEDNLQAMWEELQSGKIHLAHEVYLPISFKFIDDLIFCDPGLILLGHCWCNRCPKSGTATVQCMSDSHLWKL